MFSAYFFRHRQNWIMSGCFHLFLRLQFSYGFEFCKRYLLCPLQYLKSILNILLHSVKQDAVALRITKIIRNSHHPVLGLFIIHLPRNICVSHPQRRADRLIITCSAYRRCETLNLYWLFVIIIKRSMEIFYIIPLMFTVLIIVGKLIVASEILTWRFPRCPIWHSKQEVFLASRLERCRK